MTEEEIREPRQVSRRRFLFGAGVVVASSAVAVALPAKTTEASPQISPEASVSEATLAKPAEATVAASPTQAGVAQATAFLVVDPQKCSGCESCMLACSAAHEKKASLSTARIQITQTALAAFPFDLNINQCRQCTDPLCVTNCPTGALHVDAANGNLRMVDQSKCIGCQTCLRMCPHPAHRGIWNAEISRATKCDLCADAPYLGAQGGPGGKQACVSVCPMDALQVVTVVPSQTDDTGYVVNLRKA